MLPPPKGDWSMRNEDHQNAQSSAVPAVPFEQRTEGIVPSGGQVHGDILGRRPLPPRFSDCSFSLPAGAFAFSPHRGNKDAPDLVGWYVCKFRRADVLLFAPVFYQRTHAPIEYQPFLLR